MEGSAVRRDCECAHMACGLAGRPRSIGRLCLDGGRLVHGRFLGDGMGHQLPDWFGSAPPARCRAERRTSCRIGVVLDEILAQHERGHPGTDDSVGLVGLSGSGADPLVCIL
jgi:hypothetical protein